MIPLGQKNTLTVYMILSSADNCSPMLDNDLHDSWKSRTELYMQNREHERMILESVENGLHIWPTIEENRVARTKKYTKLSAAEKIQADCDMKAINIILQGLSGNIYLLVNHHRVTKDLWERVQLLIQDLHTTKFDPVHAYLEQHKLHANEVHLLCERNQDPLAFVANQQMIPPHFNTYPSSYNNPQFNNNFHHLIQPSYLYESQMNHQASSVLQIAYQSSQVSTQPMAESPLVDLGFVVLIFSLRDYPIAYLNKAMAFLTAVASSRFLSTNNQLRTFFNPRNQATMQDGRVIVQQVQGRQWKSYSDTGYKSNATSYEGNNASRQARVIKCYNCQGEGHMAKQCTQPKRLRNATWYKDKPMLAEAHEARKILDVEHLAFLADPGVLDGQAIRTIIQHNAAFQTKDLDTYDSDCNDVSSAKAVLMVHIPNYGLDVILEANKEQNNESVITEHERYKERVKTFEQCLNIDLSSHEKMIDSQIDDMIKEKLALKEQVDSLEQKISKQIKEKECLLQTFTVFKSEFKEKEDKYMKNEIDLKKKADEAFWYHMLNPSTKSSDALTIKIEAPKELPKVSLVNEGLKKFKLHLANFDKVVKIRTTPNARTEVQTVFDQINAVVHQSSVDKQCLEIAKKELLLENDRLLPQIMSQDVLLTVMNSMFLMGEYVNMVELSTTSNSNRPVLYPTRLKCSTSNFGLKPTCNKKNDRISRTPSRNIKNKVDAKPWKVNKKNRAVEPIRDVDVKHSLLNANFICATCDRVDPQSKVLDEQHLKTTATDEGTNTIPGVPDVPIYKSKSKKDSWGDSGEEDEDDESDYVATSDGDGDDNDDDISDNHDDDSDDERMKSDRDEISDPNLSNVDQTEHEEEDVNERVHTHSDYGLTDDEKIREEEKIDDEETIDEEEYDEVTKELYDDVNVNLGNEDTKMTNVDQGASEQQNASQHSGFEQEEEDAHVALTYVFDTQKPGGPTQSLFVSYDFTRKLLNLDNPSPADNEIASLMDTSAHHATTIPKITSRFTTPTPPPPLLFIPLSQKATPILTLTASEITTSLPALPNFTSVFKFNERVTNLEKHLSEIKQVDQYAQALSSIHAIVDRYVDNKLGEAINKTIQAHNFNCREEARIKKREYIELVDSMARKLIKEEVNSQLPLILPQAISDVATPVIEKNVVESLEAAVLTSHLEEIEVRRDDQKLYKFREGDFKRLRLQYIKDMLLLHVQQKLTNLTIDERYDLNVALHMYTRRIVIQRRVEHIQLGVVSYQKKLNLTKPDTYKSNLRNKTAYTSYSDPYGIIYMDQYKKKRLMHTDELHKFSDGMLNDVRSTLHDIVARITMEYLPMRKWNNLDKKSDRVMVQDIDKQLY
uniref:CCHC-type domain-containing protein n=1 Tax=Tanacetum cinerariifolium TaxID=118510 RepID=A0A6L2JR09_TANCI|nr:hypothetical protein [Tanacetum cinerariifolium]